MNTAEMHLLLGNGLTSERNAGITTLVGRPGAAAALTAGMAATLGFVNQVRTALMIGAALGPIGSGGFLPDLMTTDFPDGAFGVATPQVIATGTLNGRPYIDVRFNGTPTAGHQGRSQIVFDQFVEAGGIARANAVYMGIVGGALTNCGVQAFVNVSSNATPTVYQNSYGLGARALTGAAADTQKWSTTYTTDVGAGQVAACMNVTYSTGLAFDLTVRIILPQDEQGAVTHDLLISVPVNDSYFARAISKWMYGQHTNSPNLATEGFPWSNGIYAALMRGKAFNKECRWVDLTNVSDGVTDFTTLNQWKASMDAAGIIPVFTLFTGDQKPSWVTGTVTNPNVVSIKKWILAVLTNFGTSLKVVEGINEVDGIFWSGTKAAAVDLQQYIYQTAKAINPNVIVLGPSTTGQLNGMLYMRDLFALGIGQWRDVDNYHGYNQGRSYSPELDLANNMAHVTLYQRLSAQFGVPVCPVWCTENSYAHPPAISTVNQIDFVMKQPLTALSSGSEHSLWYAADDTFYGTMVDPPTGQFYETATPFKVIQMWTIGAQPGGPISAAAYPMYSMDFTRSGGYIGRFLWNPQWGTYTVPAGYTQYRDWQGNIIPVTVGDVIPVVDVPILLESGSAFTNTVSGYMVSPSQSAFPKTLWDTARDGALPAGSTSTYLAAPTLNGRPGWVGASALVDLDFANSQCFPRGWDAELVDTRAGVQNVTNAAGLIIQRAANVLPLSNTGILSEPVSANVCLMNSNMANATYWLLNNSTTTGGQADSKGGTTAVLWNEGAAAGVVHNMVPQAIGNFGITSGQVYASSIYAKAGSMSILQLTLGTAGFSGAGYANFDLAAGTVAATGGTLVGSGIDNIGGGWFRCWIAATATATNSTATVFPNGILSTAALRSATYTGTSRTINFAFPQMENKSAPTSLIDTTTAAVSRVVNAIKFQRKGIGRVVFTFDDNSTQTVSGIDTTVAYTIPTTLNRRLIKRIQAFAS